MKTTGEILSSPVYAVNCTIAIWPLPMLHLDYRQISRQSYLFNISFDYKNNPSPFLPLHPRAHTYTAREQEKSIWISNKIWKL